MRWCNACTGTKRRCEVQETVKKELNQTQMTLSANSGIREFTQKLHNKQHPPTYTPSLSSDVHGLADTSGTALFGRSSLWKEFMCFELPACAGRDIDPSISACPLSSSLVELHDENQTRQQKSLLKNGVLYMFSS